MKPETLEALKQSIAHWELMEVGGEGRPRGDECALCCRFSNGCETEDGEMCPVSASKHWQCNGTPFYPARKSFNEKDWPSFKTAARAEIEFLKSLLPKS